MSSTHFRFFFLLLILLSIGLTPPRTVLAQAVLENPQPGSFQSGVGVISGWACQANRIDIEVDGTATLQAAYGTARGDTAAACGDTNNGFGLLVNWNLLGDGSHTVRVLRDGVEFANVTIIVATLGLGQFPVGLTGESELPNFPEAGKTTRIRWQEGTQNFSIASSTGTDGSGTTSSPGTQLENPLSSSFQSGIGVISGWACEANRIDIEVDGVVTVQAAYGTERSDTATACGDTNNGFGLLVNWNDLPDGTHTLRALKDGVEFARSSFVVTTLGLGSFAQGLSGGFIVSNFPEPDRNTRVQWQESLQNFVITGSVLPEIDAAACTTASQTAQDTTGTSATFSATNPCQFRGQVQVIQVQPQIGNTLLSGQERDTRAQTTSGFFACDTNLSFTQAGKTFTSSDFEWLSNDGTRVCQSLATGDVLNTFVRVKNGSTLNFNAPFDIVYTNKRVFQWESAVLPRPTFVDNERFGGSGPPANCSLFVSPSRIQFCNGENYLGPQFFTLTSICPLFLQGSVFIRADNDDFRITRGSSFTLEPNGGTLIIVDYSGQCPATSRGKAAVFLGNSGVADVLLNPVE
ncbi:MAG: hypothetical protein AB7G75_02040 [Candidatus Binatia bacterium]